MEEPLNQNKMEKQQTAVEWLETQFQKDNLSKEILNVFKRSFEQAKAMEKEQKEKFWTNEEVLRIIQECKSYLSFGDEFNEFEWFNKFKK